MIRSATCSKNLKSYLGDFQELMLSQIPSFTIAHIAVSPKGQKLLLWGEHGIAVVEIPRRRRANGVTTCRYNT